MIAMIAMITKITKIAMITKITKIGEVIGGDWDDVDWVRPSDPMGLT
jgi:hypothetical protein